MLYAERKDFYGYRNERKSVENSEAKVKELLVSPLTAVFCSAEELTVISLENGGVKLQGFVNSQNSYGAMIRTVFTIHGLGDSSNFSVTHVTMKNQAAEITAASYGWAIVITIILYLFISTFYDMFIW